jgi:hypothetical protein
MRLSASVRTELKRDITVFLTAFVGTDVLDGDLTRAALLAAIVTAAKVAARKRFPHEDAA